MTSRIEARFAAYGAGGALMVRPVGLPQTDEAAQAACSTSAAILAPNARSAVSRSYWL